MVKIYVPITTNCQNNPATPPGELETFSLNTTTTTSTINEEGEIVLIELQGELMNFEENIKKKNEKFIVGELKFEGENFDTPILYFGAYRCEGRLVKLEKPWLLLAERLSSVNTTTAPSQETNIANTQLISKVIIRKKYLFKTRPSMI
ncbi:10603_t:CDS:2 [Ambispora gerdemannii]|uniref:10603_t:CDS:1 n=1 Tax=Ambispora gerdemannii TaxID=144530 RepID=A0A9N9GHM9_9GLOM|nr:10603_t:CDS:2 [Ambispora gerdemannii]